MNSLVSTDRLRLAFRAARDEAIVLGSATVAPEHALHTILEDPKSGACAVLHALNIDALAVRNALRAQFTEQPYVEATDLPYASGLKHAIYRAHKLARVLVQPSVSTECVLFGLAAELESTAGVLLSAAGDVLSSRQATSQRILAAITTRRAI